MTKRKVFILLTRFPGNGSKVLGAITGCYYTHASIGLEEDMNTFYSFVCKGFIVEKITRYIKPDREPFPCQLYELSVSEQVYQAIKRILVCFVENRPFLRYTRFGVILCLLHIPYKRRYHYYCSFFVAEVLLHSKAICLHKDCALYLPNDFRSLPGIQLNFQGNLQSMMNHFGLLPCAV